MRAKLARYDLIRTMEKPNLMGDLIFIKDGYATTIHANGDVTIYASDTCDVCLRKVSVLGGLTTRDLAGEVIQWTCAECRA